MYPFIDTMYVNEQIYIHAQYKEHLSNTSYAVCVFSSTGSKTKYKNVCVVNTFIAILY